MCRNPCLAFLHHCVRILGERDLPTFAKWPSFFWCWDQIEVKRQERWIFHILYTWFYRWSFTCQIYFSHLTFELFYTDLVSSDAERRWRGRQEGSKGKKPLRWPCKPPSLCGAWPGWGVRLREARHSQTKIKWIGNFVWGGGGGGFVRQNVLSSSLQHKLKETVWRYVNDNVESVIVNLSGRDRHRPAGLQPQFYGTQSAVVSHHRALGPGCQSVTGCSSIILRPHCTRVTQEVWAIK